MHQLSIQVTSGCGNSRVTRRGLLVLETLSLQGEDESTILKALLNSQNVNLTSLLGSKSEQFSPYPQKPPLICHLFFFSGNSVWWLKLKYTLPLPFHLCSSYKKLTTFWYKFQMEKPRFRLICAWHTSKIKCPAFNIQMNMSNGQ